MKKRFTFRCWNCKRTYTLYREITDQQEIIVACPYCLKEGVVDLRPYPFTTEVLRAAEDEEIIVRERQLPEVLPTQPRESSSD